jgi:hypothetical protein
MDKLEHYLDQVCRGIGGPRSLRQHVRQELREHLLDAAAARRNAGLSEEEAMSRALAGFGAAELVGSELAALRGHRLMAVVIDKAIDWKEMTAIWVESQRAFQRIDHLTRLGAAAEFRVQLNAAKQWLQQAQDAIPKQDLSRLEAAMQKFRKLYAPVHNAATKAVHEPPDGIQD